MYFGLITIKKSTLMPEDGTLNALNPLYAVEVNSKYNYDSPIVTYIPANTRVVFFPTTRVNRIDDDDDDDDIEQSTTSQQVGGRRKRKSNRRKSNKRKSNKRRSQKRRGSRRK
jgi:hypothetical protein